MACLRLNRGKGTEQIESMKLLAFFREWIKNRSADKTGTCCAHQRAFNHLSVYFSEDTLLVEVTEYDAECYSRFLRREQKLAESTARKMVDVAKQYHVSDAEVKATEMAEKGKFTNEETPENSGVSSLVRSGSEEQGGPNWTRTSGLHDVNVAL